MAKFFHCCKLYVLGLVATPILWGSYHVTRRSGAIDAAAAKEMVCAIRNQMLKVSKPTDIGLILRAEIGNNDPRARLSTQKVLLSNHLRQNGHYADWYAQMGRRMGSVRELSKYKMMGLADQQTADVCDQITATVLDLLLSGRVSFSVGKLQSNGRDSPSSATNINGFVLYANLVNHDIAKLDSPCGIYIFKGKGIDTNYIRIAVQIIHGTGGVPLNDSFADLDPSPALQVIIVTMFHENPASDGLRDSILPNGVDAARNPRGVAVGGAPLPPAPDNRIPPVAPLAPAAP